VGLQRGEKRIVFRNKRAVSKSKTQKKAEEGGKKAVSGEIKMKPKAVSFLFLR
jgi:hypothetical protein